MKPTPEDLILLATVTAMALPGPWVWEEGMLLAGEEIILWPENVPGDAQTWSQRLGSVGRMAEPLAEVHAQFIATANPTMVKFLIEKLATFEAALTDIAAFKDKWASERLKSTGNYAAFDEPNAVETARKALVKF